MTSDQIMIIITAIYVIATIILCVLSWMTLKESKKQFKSSLELQRQHNCESVRPALTIDCFIGTEKGVSGGRITITNHGLGPAVIKELNFRRNDKEYKNINGCCTISDLVNFRLLEENEDLDISKLYPYFYCKEIRDLIEDKSYLAVNKELLIFSFTVSCKEDYEHIGKIFDNVLMELVYTDIFDSNKWKVTKSLDCFKPLADVEISDDSDTK